MNSGKRRVLSSFMDAITPYYLTSVSGEDRELSTHIACEPKDIYDIMTKDVADVLEKKFAGSW